MDKAKRIDEYIGKNIVKAGELAIGSQINLAYGKPLNYRNNRRISILVQKGKLDCKSVKLVLLTRPLRLSR